MSSAPRSGMRLSTSGRVFGLFAALLVVAFALTGALTYFATERAAEFGIRDRINLDMQAMEIELESEGFEPMIAAIRARADLPGAMLYRLERSDGVLVMDDLHTRETIEGWARVTSGPSDVYGPTLVVLTRRLRDGSRLSIGEDTRRAETVRASVLSALAWSAAGAFTIGLVVAAVVARRSLAKVDGVSNAVSRFAAGDLSVRAPAPGPGMRDDIDTIAEGINQMLDRIALLVGSVRRVSTAAAHDLRTPLAHVRQRLEVVADERANAAERAEAAQAAQFEIDEVLRTFDAILDLSRIEAAPRDDTFEALDLAALAEGVADAYSADIEASGRTLDLQCAGPVQISGDRHLLARAIANLLENAMRHTPQGSAIVLRAEACADTARLEVSDNGGGLTEEARARVVEPYYRADRSRSSKGSGLGLAIVAAIANRHGARLMLEDATPGLRVVLEFKRLDRGQSLV